VKMRDYLRVGSLEEAYEALALSPKNVLLAGTTALKYAGRIIETGIDISGLGLDYIAAGPGLAGAPSGASDGALEDLKGSLSRALRIGATTSLRRVETDESCVTACAGALSSAVGRVGGVQLRNLATLGGAVASRWPMSDTLAVLLALDGRLHFHRAGWQSLESYLSSPAERDILTEILIPHTSRTCAWEAQRLSYTDFPILTVSAAQGAASDGEGRSGARIAVGGRPGRATLAKKAMEAWDAGAEADEIGRVAAQELDFGDDARASGNYRREICAVLVERALLAVRGASR